MTGLLPTVGIVVFAALLPQTTSAASATEDARAKTACTAGVMCAARNARTAQTRSAPLREDELPWCISADDPRCAPLHTGDTGRGRFDADARLVLSAAQTDASDTAQLPTRSQSFTPRAGLPPRHGVSHRVERPPRASQRPL